MGRVVCNIPHASTIVPEWAKKDFHIEHKEIEELLEFITDIRVDELWNFVPKASKVVAKISRIILDVERYRNDEDEPMAERGMGLYYTHTPTGEVFRNKSDDTYRKCLEIYDDYHMTLLNKVEACLNKHGECVLLDCHSFHDEMDYTGYNTSKFPDVCIGVNGKLPKEAEIIIQAFASAGYVVKVNEPFAGAIVPIKHIDDPRVTPVMIEVNRRIYTGENFEKIQNICREIYECLA